MYHIVVVIIVDAKANHNPNVAYTIEKTSSTLPVSNEVDFGGFSLPLTAGYRATANRNPPAINT